MAITSSKNVTYYLLRTNYNKKPIILYFTSTTEKMSSNVPIVDIKYDSIWKSGAKKSKMRAKGKNLPLTGVLEIFLLQSVLDITQFLRFQA